MDFWAAYEGWQAVHGKAKSDQALTADDVEELQRMMDRCPDEPRPRVH